MFPFMRVFIHGESYFSNECIFKHWIHSQNMCGAIFHSNKEVMIIEWTAGQRSTGTFLSGGLTARAGIWTCQTFWGKQMPAESRYMNHPRASQGRDQWKQPESWERERATMNSGCSRLTVFFNRTKADCLWQRWIKRTKESILLSGPWVMVDRQVYLAISVPLSCHYYVPLGNVCCHHPAK